MKNYIEKIQNQENLSQQEIESVMQEIMSGEASKDDMAALFQNVLRSSH